MCINVTLKAGAQKVDHCTRCRCFGLCAQGQDEARGSRGTVTPPPPGHSPGRPGLGAGRPRSTSPVLGKLQKSLPTTQLQLRKCFSEKRRQPSVPKRPRALHRCSAVPVVTNHLLQDKRVIDPVQCQWFH